MNTENVHFGHFRKGSGGNDNGGGNDMLETRVQQLEKDMSEIKRDVAVIKSNYATKEDVLSLKVELHQSISNQTKWIVATLFAVTGLALALAKYLF